MHKVLMLGLIAVYPFAVYFGLHYFEVKIMGLIIASLFLVRWWLMHKSIHSFAQRSFYPIIILGVGCALVSSIFNNADYIKLTPGLISLVCLFTFSYTLWRPPSMIERIARMSTPDLPESAIAYTAKVTVAWCLFFIVNALAAFYTALYTSLKIWTLYNGLLSYLLMGLLFAVEYCVRQQVIKKQDTND